MFHSRRIDTGSCQVHLESSTDSGPNLLCLHGVLRAGRDFAPLLGALTPRWTVHLLDHRGHGESSRPGRYSVADYIADAIAVVRDHLPGEVTLLGHSLGALVALGVAAAVPDRIRGIILEDPPAPSLLADVKASAWYGIWAGMQSVARLGLDDTRSIHHALANLQVPVAGGHTARLGDLRDGASIRFSARCLRDLDPEVFAPLLESRWLEGFSLDQVLTRVSCPTLLLRGDLALGGMLGHDEAMALVNQLADGILVNVPGVGHLIHWTDAETMSRLLLGFLGALLV